MNLAARRSATSPACRPSSRACFPFADFRGACELQFVKYAIGNWECKCGRLKGLEHLRMDLHALRQADRDGAPARGDGLLPALRRAEPEPRRRSATSAATPWTCR